jgi:hypothetical protein
MRDMSRTILAIGLLWLWPGVAQAHGTRAAYEVVTHTAHGVRLTLIVHRTVYPMNALAAVTVVTQNVSRHPVSVLANIPRYGQISPDVVSQDQHGRKASLPTLAEFGFPAYPQSSAQSVRLNPGQVMRSERFVVVSGVRLVALVTETTHAWAWSETSTPPIWITLGPSDAPRLVLRHAGTQVFATITSRPSNYAPMYDVTSANCISKGKDTFVAHMNWLPVLGTRILPGCSPMSEWHLVVGQLNHSVATADCVYPSLCGPRPIPVQRPTAAPKGPAP